MNSKQLLLLVMPLAALTLAACNGDSDPEPPTESPQELAEQVGEQDEIPELFLPVCDFAPPPSPPVPNYPAEGDIVLDLQPTFDWTFGLECEPMGYHLDVFTAAGTQGIPDVFNDDTGSLQTTFSGVSLLPATWHKWRVCAIITPGGMECHSNYPSFVTGPSCDASQLVAPTLVYPADGSIYTGKSWGNPFEVETDIVYPGGTCLPYGFNVYISETADFSTPSLNMIFSSPQAWYTPNPDGLLLAEDDSNDVPDCTQLYWKAWATVDSVNGPESEVFSFYTNIEGNCFVPLPWEDIFYIELPQDANCRASDGADSRNIATLYEGEQLAMLAINPEGTHVRVMESKFDVKCWAWLGVVDLMKGNEIIDPSIVLELGPIVDPVEPPVEEPADEPAEEVDEPAEEADEPAEDADEPADEPDDDPTEEPAQCSDGIDNDGDGAIDYGDTAAIASGKADRECSSPDDDNEAG